MKCPLCQLELGVERQAGAIVLTYAFKQWSATCRCRASGGAALCDNLLPTFNELLRANGAPIRGIKPPD
jgi:hypothetical protein